MELCWGYVGAMLGYLGTMLGHLGAMLSYVGHLSANVFKKFSLPSVFTAKMNALSGHVGPMLRLCWQKNPLKSHIKKTSKNDLKKRAVTMRSLRARTCPSC